MTILNTGKDIGKSAQPLVSCQFDPGPKILQRLVTLAQGTPWNKAALFMAYLHEQGFSAPPPKSLNSYGPAELTQSLLISDIEVSMFYASFDDRNLMAFCGLSWSVSEGLLASQMDSAIKSLINRMNGALGPADAMVTQTEHWIKSGLEPDVVVFSCFWNSPINTEGFDNSESFVKPTRLHSTDQAYRDDLRRQNRPITLSVTASKDGLGVNGTWSATALVSV